MQWTEGSQASGRRIISTVAFFGASQVLECWTTLTAIAVSTSDVKVGPLVLNVANREPAVLASMAATLQEVSGGRLLLGLGAGGGTGVPFRREEEAIGRADAADPVRRARVEACAEEMRRLWDTPGFLRPDPVPPVVIAAFGPKMAELAGRVGDGINAPALHPRLRELVAIARDARVDAGRDPGKLPRDRVRRVRRDLARRRLASASRFGRARG